MNSDLLCTGGALRERSSSGPHVGKGVPDNGIFWGVPARNQYFYGRGKYLQELHLKLSQESRDQPSSCLIHAMGGMGKTDIALEYAHRYRHHFDCIFWLGAQQAPDLAINFAKIAVKLQIPNAETMGLGRKIEIVKDWLESGGN